MRRSAIPQFIMSNQETINALFLDHDSKDNMKVYSMNDLYHQIQRINDTVRNWGFWSGMWKGN